MLKSERMFGGKGTLRCGEITSLVGGVVGCEVTCGVEMVGGESSWWRDDWKWFKILSPATFSIVYVVQISCLNSTHRIMLNFLCTFS